MLPPKITSPYNLRKIGKKEKNNFVRGSIIRDHCAVVFAIDSLTDPEIIAGRYGNKRADIRQLIQPGMGTRVCETDGETMISRETNGGRKIAAVKRPPSIINPGAIRLSINSLVPRIFRAAK